MAYTFEITNGTTTYTFDVQPEFKRDVKIDFDESKSPAEPTVHHEFWTLSGAVYRNATQATVTTDFQTLVDLLENKASPVNSVKFKRDGSTVWELETTTYHMLMVTGLESDPGPGHLVNHWKGTISVTARKLLQGSGASAGIIKLEKRITDSYDDAGLRTHVLEGRVETLPGTSARDKAEAQGEDSLGATFYFVTGGTDEIEVTVLNEPEDTIATFRQEQKESGRSIPSTATSFRMAVETAEDGGGLVTTYHVHARGTSIANARTAVRTEKPSTGLWRVQEREDQDGLGYSAVYTTRERRTTARYAGAPRITSMRRSFTFQGGGRSFLEDPIPGFKPFVTRGPYRWLVVRESVVVRAVNVGSEADIPLPAIPWPDNLQATECDDTAPELDDDEAEKRAADRYVRRATRVYVFPEDPPDTSALMSAIFNGPAFATEPDFVVRTKVED